MKRKIPGPVLAITLAVLSLCACGSNKETSAPSSAASSIPAKETEKETEKEAEKEAEREAEKEDLAEEISDEPQEPEKEEKDLVLYADGTVDYRYYYAPVLSRVYYVMTYPLDDFDYGEGENWLLESSHYANNANNLKTYGYCIKDLSGDGIPELVLTDKVGMSVYNLYTLDENYEPYLVCEGWSRNRYGYLGGNEFECFASVGGRSEIMGIYELSENGQELIPVDYYFTCESTSSSELETYHNTTGEPVREISERIDNEDFLLAWHQYEAKISSLECVPYSEKTIKIAFEEDNPGKTITGRYVADVTEYARTVIVYDDNGMTDVELLGLNYADFTERSNLVLDINPIYEMGNTEGDEAIAVTITFGETIPCFGIRYKDADGVERKFAADLSGDDGSVYLWEF